MRYPAATWRGPIPNENHNGMQLPPMGLVLHIEQGSESSANNWFHNPGAQASAHFGNPKTGPMDQWVDTADEAWAEMAGNSRWFSVEHEGVAPVALTPSQLENDAQLLVWLYKNDIGVPLQITDSPTVRGLGWHGMGGEAWGGHFGCPGDPIKAQRAAIIKRANAILHPPVIVKIVNAVLHPIIAAKRNKAIIVNVPSGGEGIANVKSQQWQGIPSPAERDKLLANRIKYGKVPSTFWATAKQIAW